jgi:putative ABC transport system ATP-binding protein
MITLENICKSYDEEGKVTPVLHDISVRIDAGEYVAIMGTSGTGKSTLMNIIGILDRPSSGRYLFEKTDVSSLDDEGQSLFRNQKIGFVFQQFNLLHRTSARNNVLLPFLYAASYPSDAVQRANAALGAVGLADRASYRPTQLSGGQQQRVAVARALINNPEMILADEPTGNLDRRSGLEVLATFQRLNREGRTVVLVTHDEEVARHAGRILRMSDGRIVEDRVVEDGLDAEAELSDLGSAEVVR